MFKAVQKSPKHPISKFFLLHFLFVMGCIVKVTIVYSSEKLHDLETVQVTGSRLADYKDLAVSKITRAQIEQINPLSTLELLQRLPNVLVSQNGVGGLSYVSIRGGESNFTLILIDGVAVNDSTNSRGGGFDFSQLNPDVIETIELYRGGISAIYGGEAISGVINIKTRNSQLKSAGLSIGSQKSYVAHAAWAQEFKHGFSVLTQINQQGSQESLNAKTENLQALLKLSLQRPNYQHVLLGMYSNTENTSFAEDSGGERFAQPFLTEQRDAQQQLLALNSEYQLPQQTLLKDSKINTAISWLKRTENSAHPGIADGTLSGIPASSIFSSYERIEAELTLTQVLNQQMSFVGGVNYRDIEGSNDGNLDFGFPVPVDYRLNQRILSGFAELRYANDIANKPFSVNLGWRFDDAKEFGSENSFRVSTSYALTDNTSLFASYNEGYKLPSFFALAHPLVGNPELQPERSQNIELGLEYNWQQSQVSLMYFDNQFTDLVDFDASLFTNVNRSNVEAKGVELAFSHPFFAYLALSMSATYQDLKVNGSSSELRRRPSLYGNAALDVNIEKFTFSLFVDAREEYLDSSIPTGLTELGGYAVYGASLNYQYNENLIVRAKIDNLFAKRFEDSVGFVNDKTRIRIGIDYRF